MISNHHALHLMCILTIFSCIIDVCYICWFVVCCLVWIGLSPWCFLCCISHANAFSCICTFIFLYSYIDLFGTFLRLSLSLSLSLFLALVCSMAPKRKSTSSRNPLHSGASSSSSPSDPTPSHVLFHDDKACKGFSKNFSRQGIHLECQVILSDFSDTDLSIVIYSWVWESLYGIPVTCPSIIM